MLGLFSASVFGRYTRHNLYRLTKNQERMEDMEHKTSIGRSNLKVPRIGIGAMTWGQPRGMVRWTPAQLAYGPSHGASEEERALEVSLAAGVNLIDTAEMYSSGASERRVGSWRAAETS